MTTKTDTIIDYIGVMKDAVYIARDPEISVTERNKLLREIEDELYNLEYYVKNEVD